MAGLRVPLSTLRRRPCDRQRRTRGRDGWLGLSRVTLAFTTPCRFVPAHCRSLVILMAWLRMIADGAVRAAALLASRRVATTARADTSSARAAGSLVSRMAWARMAAAGPVRAAASLA